MLPLARHDRVPDFDGLARIYRWLEYLSFGPALQRCRTRLLAALTVPRDANALVLGDGDGRGLHALLSRRPDLTVTAIDASSAMLHQLLWRCDRHRERVSVISGDAREITRTLAPQPRFDLIVTHFFLDCLDGPGLRLLIHNATAHTCPDATWLLSEFRIAPGWRAAPSRLLVALLYLAFGALTGLRTRSLPDHARALGEAGWHRVCEEHSLGGLLTSELWQRLPSGHTAL